jgi:23S rRNA (uracil1939-C5)-methyltransferase
VVSRREAAADAKAASLQFGDESQTQVTSVQGVSRSGRLAPQKKQSFTVEKLVPGGAGFFRLADGRPAFVEGAFPGDRIVVHELTEKRGYVRASRWELEESGKERVEPVCPIVDRCGGCDWMRLDLAAQRRHKADLVVEALARTGGVTLDRAPDVVVDGDSLHYRRRLRLHVDDTGAVGFRGRSSHAVVRATGCSVAAPPLDQVIGVLASLEREHRRKLGRMEAVELELRDDGGVDLALVPRAGYPTPDVELAPLVARLEQHATVTKQGRSFSQVNAAVNDRLVGAVVDGAEKRRALTFLDLYAGTGNFSVPLAAGGRVGVAVELDGRAAGAARSLAKRQNLRLEVLAVDVARALPRLVEERRTFDLVVLDPPRTGAKAALDAIVTLAPAAVAYVSCDPVTLARDLRGLADRYDVDAVTCFDMFPQTHHVEVLAWLSRR